MYVCRFVEFATTRDVLNAIQEFNDYNVGREKKLIVKVKEDKTKREERMAWINKERDFLNSLHATGELEELEIDKGVPDNPLEPRYIPHHPTSPEKPTPPAGESGGPSDASLGSSAGAASLKASPPRTGSEEIIINKTSPKEQNNKGERSKLPCHVCQTPTLKKCCEVPYCSHECQKEDRSVHKKTCTAKLSRSTAQVQKQPDSSPPASKVEEKISPIPDGPLSGFYVSLGGSDDFEDDDDIAADACVSLSPPGKEGHSNFSLDFVQTASSDKVSFSDTNVPEVHVDSTSSDSLFPYPSLLNSPLSASLPSQEQPCDNDVNDDDMLECQPETPPGSPPLPGQSSDTQIQTPPPIQDSPREDIAPALAVDRQSENSFKKSGVKHLSTREILAVFDQCPTPLSSHPISEFPPAEFIGIVTSAHSPTQFHAVLATSHIKEALVKLLDYGSSVTPVYCGPTGLSEGSLYGYTDDYGDFYRVELVYRSGAVVLYDMGLRLSIQTSCLFQLSEDIKSIPRLCFQMTLNKLHYEPDKKEDGREFLFSLMRGHPMSVTNHSIRAYKSNVDINFIIASVTSLDHSIDVSNQVLKNGFAKKKEDSSSGGKGKSQSKDSVFRKKLDSSPSKVDSSPGKVSPTNESPTEGQGEKESGSGDSAVAPLSQQTSDGVGSPPVKLPLLNSPPNVRKPMFIDGSPDKMGRLRNTINMNQNENQSPEIRPQTPPTQKVQTPDSKSSIKYKLVQMSNKVPFHNPPVGVMFEIQPIVVLNPNIIWAQVIHNNVNNFKMMEADLNRVYGSRKNEPYAPAPGEMCAAKYPQDQKYYRVEVLCVNHSGTVDIQLVDHGHRDTVTMRQIHHLEPIFLSLPKQALQFSLVGVVPAGMANTWSDNAIAFLKEKILNRVVSVKIVMQTPATCMAEVWDPDEPMQLLNTSLVGLGLAQEPSMFGHFSGGGGMAAGGDAGVALRGVSITARQDQPKTQSTTLQEHDELPLLVASEPDVSSHSPHDSKQSLGMTASSPSPAKPLLHFSLPVLLKPGDFEKPKPPATFSPLLSPPSSLPSSASHVEKSPGVLPSQSNFPKSETESQKRPSFSAKSPTSSLSPSTPVGGWSSTKQPSASRNVSSSTSSTIFAKSDNSAPKQPSTTPSSCATATKPSGWSPKQPSTPNNATPSSHTNVAKTDGWSAKRSSTSQTVFSSSSAEPIPTEVGGWSPKQPGYSVSMSVSNNTATTKDLSPTAPRGCGWSLKPSSVQQEEVLKSSTGRGRSPQAQTNRQPTLRNGQKSTVNTVQLEANGDPAEAIMLYVENPLRFYIQVVKDESCDSYMKMVNELNEVDLVPLSNPSCNDFCLCRFPNDGTIGRVKILKVDSDCIHVQRIDYGNRKKVTLDALFKMDQQFSRIPAQAIPCTLNQLLNPSGKNSPWTREAMDFFIDQVRSGKGSPDILTVTCVQVVRGVVHVVNVTTSAQRGGKDLLGLMVDAKLGGSAAIKFDKRANQRSKQEEAPKERRPPNRSPFSKTSPSNLIGSPIKQSTSSSEGGLPWAKVSSDEGPTAQPDSPFKKQSMKSPVSNQVSPSEDRPDRDLFKSPEMVAASVAQTDSPFKKQAMKSPFSEGQSKISPPKDSPGKALFKSETAQASTKPSSSKRSSVLVSAMEKVLLSLKCDTLTLLVTEVSSPDELYVHTADSAGKSDELFTLLSNYFSKNKLQPFSQAPAQGSLVCAKFSQDGAWYRAEVLESSADGCHVRFIDYGNAELVQFCDMTECPAEFISIPILASCCRLGGVAPPMGSTTWSEKATQLLKEATSGVPLQAELVNSSCSPQALKLSNKEGDLATELINRGLASAPRASTAVKAARLTPCTYPQVTSLPKVPLPSDSDSFTVLVSEVCSPDKLYIQTANFAEEIDKLCSSLFSHFTSKQSQLLTQPPSVGCLVCAKFSGDGVWYRGEVLETSGDSCRVRFIDYGNAEVVHLCDVTECPSEFVSIPILASCCQLSGVVPPAGGTIWSNKATQLLKEATSGVPLQAVIVDPACSPPALKLTNKEDVDLATELVSRGLAAASGISPAREKTVKPLSITTYPQVASLPKVSLPSDSDSFTVLVTDISSPAEFYIQTANSAGIDELCSSLYNHFMSNEMQPLTQPPGAGCLVCAKFSQDSAWYRAKVLESSADGCRVRFIDYGNAETVHISDMTECPAEFVSIPILASCCQLGGVTPPTGSMTWSDEATQLLKEASSGVPLQAVIVDPACSPPALKLTNKEDVDIATELVSRGLAAASGISPAREKTVKPLSITTYPQVASLPKVSLPSDSDSFTVLVTDISSPAEFYIQTANSAGIDELCSSLYNHFMSNEMQPLTQPPGAGCLVCAKFSQDGAWYRAKVLESSADGCRVRFIDYGNAETVQISDMTECPAKFVSIPVLASCCQLGGVTPPTGSTMWSDEATQLLKEASSGVPLWAVIVDPACSPPALKLTNSEDEDLATVLINKGLAAASRPPKTSSSARASPNSAPPKVSSLQKVPLPHQKTSSTAKPTSALPPETAYPKVSSLQKVSLPQENKQFFMVVTDVYSPDQFYIQTLEDSGAIDQLSELLNEHYRKNKPILLTQPPATGSLVCARFSIDNAWYRGEVLEASPDSCRILFIDYGNTESVKLSDMAQCPEEFVSTAYPMLASSCCLSGVVPPIDSTGWSDKATQLLISMASDSLSEGVIVDKSTSRPSLKLKNDSFTDFATELVMKGLARHCATFPSSAMKHSPKKPTPPPADLYPKVSGMKKAELGSNSDYFTAIVSDVWSPEAFFIVSFNQNTQSVMEELRNGLNSHLKMQPPSLLIQPPSQGSLVCAKYSRDGTWYRSEVLESYKDSCKLLFIDYGNVEVARLEDMAPCPVKFISFPILATKCSLSGITLSSINAKAWSSEIIALFKQLTCGVINVKAVSDGSGGDTIPVELVDTNGSSDVNIASKLITRVQELAGQSTDAKVAEVMFADDDISVAELPDRVPIKVRIVFVIDPSEFFVHNCEKRLISAFQEMGMTLQSTYNTSESKYRGFVPQIDALCCCQSLLTPDKSWYRCKVVSVIGKKEAKIQSLDFGFSEKIPVNKLFYLDPKFTTLPAQAVPCYLNGVAPASAFGWNNAAKAMFKSLLKEKMNAVAEKDKSLLDSHDRTGISLFTSNRNKSVATALIESGYAVVDPYLALMSKLSGQCSAPQSSSDNPKVPPIPIPHGPIPTTKSFPVILTHMESLSEFYLQVATKEKLGQFCELLRMVHEYAQSAKNFNSLPPLGTLCIAMHSDDSWYRAQVVKIINKQTCSVFFFDFGNVGEMSLLKMKPITEEKLLSCPIQALKCGLYGASVIPSRKRLEVMNLFSTLVPLETVKNCRVISKYPLLVDLECGSGCPTLSLRDELARNDCLPKPNDLGMLSLPTIKLSTDYKPVLLTEIKDPSDFWLQLVDKSVAHQFDLLTQEIHCYATGGGAVQTLIPVLGQLCIAKYSEDGVWYRAKVIQINKLDPLGDELKVKVQFIDYGNEEVVDIDQLRPFQHQFKCLPAQAVHCSLVGFKVPAPNLAKEFRTLVENKQLFAAVQKDSVPGELCTSVELIDSSGDEDVYIHSKLS